MNFQNNGDIIDAFRAGEQTVIHSKDDPENHYEQTIKILDSKGKQVFSRNYKGITNLSVSDDGNRILIPHNRASQENRPFYEVIYDSDIIDSTGNTISVIKQYSTPYLKMSENGKYAITTEVGGAEDEGHFQLFNINNNKELTIGIDIEYQFFLADFLGDDEIVIILQPFPKIIRDTETNKIIDQIQNAAILYIYNIPNNKIVIKKELTSNRGNVVWFSFYNGLLKTSENGNYIALAANDLPVKQKNASNPYCLIVMEKNGDIISQVFYEKEGNDSEGILSCNFVQDIYLLLEKYGLKESEIYLYEMSDFSLKWIQKIGSRKQIKIQSANIFDNKLGISSLNQVMELSIDNGDIFYLMPEVKKIKQKNTSKILIINKNNSVQYFEN
ncbi:MAG: hypothetical protein JXR46_09840 [Calditrichaceae bacterium]|nr:hypothetical protein [Calditrichaceae bacterium]MBN2709335.1 hypothetical protein [Calditrichaceae bacterium]RQV94668.1 MAG: hypothetical protein EH224_09620 [Calditrichota bacterium]